MSNIEFYEAIIYILTKIIKNQSHFDTIKKKNIRNFWKYLNLCFFKIKPEIFIFQYKIYIYCG